MHRNGLFIILFILLFEMIESQVLERQLSFHYCRYDVDCKNNAFCSGNTDITSGRCECKENFVLVDRNKTYYECLPIAESIDSPCSQDLQCQIKLGNSASCNANNKVCECTENSYLAPDNHCYKSVVIGDLCVSHYNCRLTYDSYGFCTDGKCTCDINYHPSDDGRTCYPSALLGKSCTMSESCVQTFANCAHGICRCLAGYVESDNNTLCWKAATKVGDDCVENIQCSEYVKGSYCDKGVCVCKDGHHGYGNECVPDAKLGEFCNSDKECIMSSDLEHSVRCNDRICVCVEGISDGNFYGCIIVSGSNQILNVMLVTLFFVLLARYLN